MSTIDTLSVNAIRVLSADAIQKANSGHPGLPLGCAPTAYELWMNHMNHNPADPKWANRDRFILSGGHGSMLLYSLLHLFGYGDLSKEDLMNFRQLGSKTAGHPEYGHTVGVEATTGPLGAGMGMAVGMAIAEAHLAEVFNKENYPVVDHYTFVLGGDGCMMEGISSEAFSLAGTLGLGKLIVLYDSNQISIEGSTDIAFTENVQERMQAFGFQTLTVEDGNDLTAIGNAIEEAKADLSRPSFITIKTQIGYGCPAKQGKASAHGEPLGVENVAELRKSSSGRVRSRLRYRRKFMRTSAEQVKKRLRLRQSGKLCLLDTARSIRRWKHSGTSILTERKPLRRHSGRMRASGHRLRSRRQPVAFLERSSIA